MKCARVLLEVERERGVALYDYLRRQVQRRRQIIGEQTRHAHTRGLLGAVEGEVKKARLLVTRFLCKICFANFRDESQEMSVLR